MYYENNWESLNSRPVPKWFGDAKIGIFITYGLYSVPAFTQRGQYAEWYGQMITYDGHAAQDFHRRTYGEKFKYEDFVGMFKAELFDPDQWAELFQKSGAKYTNLISKYHDGFCMYKTPYAYQWNSVDVGPHRDIVGEFKKSIEKTDVKFGVYHSIYEWTHPLYLKNPEEFSTEHLIPMMKEMIEKYQPWTLFTDGEWDHPSNVWHSTDFLQWLYNESSVKDTIVVNDRWGKETRGELGGYYTTEYGTIGNGKEITDFTRPYEECRGFGSSFGYNRIERTEDYLTPKQVLVTLCDLVSKGGNLLINVGPAADGTIPVIMEERLLQMGKWLEVNGEAIYSSKVYDREGEAGVYYTQNNGNVYAILDMYPFGTKILEKVPYSEGLSATVLGCEDAPITVRDAGGKVELCFPAINPDDMKSEWLYTIRLENTEPNK
ncbi:MAG: alpha-L-fucosidase [Ruminococcaceae bacterium]|nr:alpha-L-fucosidase [Oscillospiraceae bacterium]